MNSERTENSLSVSPIHRSLPLTLWSCNTTVILLAAIKWHFSADTDQRRPGEPKIWLIPIARSPTDWSALICVSVVVSLKCRISDGVSPIIKSMVRHSGILLQYHTLNPLLCLLSRIEAQNQNLKHEKQSTIDLIGSQLINWLINFEVKDSYINWLVFVFKEKQTIIWFTVLALNLLFRVKPTVHLFFYFLVLLSRFVLTLSL